MAATIHKLCTLNGFNEKNPLKKQKKNPNKFFKKKTKMIIFWYTCDTGVFRVTPTVCYWAENIID